VITVVYSTAAQVKAIVSTDMLNADITELIEETDAWMDAKLPTGTMNAFILRMISRTWTAVRVMLRDPEARSLGDYSENRAQSLLKLNAMLDEMIKDSSGGVGMRYSYERLNFG